MDSSDIGRLSIVLHSRPELFFRLVFLFFFDIFFLFLTIFWHEIIVNTSIDLGLFGNIDVINHFLSLDIIINGNRFLVLVEYIRDILDVFLRG